jgi:DNA polymerase-3 subunit alpha
VWERELLGLYLSAHPLDRYDDYFAEQTVPLASLETGHDKKAVVVGGVLSSVRTILTKSGSKMAFLKLEDKSGEGEVIVFPKTYEEVGEKLLQDVVVKVSGKVSSTDRDGNSLGEAKVIADEVIFVTSDELDNYEKIGKNMKIPKAKTAEAMAEKSSQAKKSFNQPGTESSNVTYQPIEDEPLKKLYVHVKNPDDHATLKNLKTCLNDHSGPSEIILVLGEDKKSALRLPYRVDVSERLTSRIVDLYGSDCVIVK